VIWLFPLGLAGALLALGPLAVHLLTRRRAKRIAFPSLRFVRTSRAAAVRLRAPTDPLLLAVRMAIVLLAALAGAQPLVTWWRAAEWQARVARAIVIDTSPGMALAGSDGAVLQVKADAIAAREAETAWRHTEIRAADLRQAVIAASHWLDAAPPAVRELVVISDFQAGVIDEAALAQVSRDAGVRLVPAGTLPSTRALPPGDARGWRDGRWTVATTLAEATTTAAWTRAGPAGAPADVRIVTRDAERDAAARMLTAVASLGSWTTPEPRPVDVVFPGGVSPEASASAATPWIARAIVRLREDPVLAAAATQTAAVAAGQKPGAAERNAAERALDEKDGVPIARDAQGRLAVSASEGADHRLIVRVAAEPGSLLGAAAVRASLQARAGGAESSDAEPAAIPADTLARWNRPPGAVPAGAWRQVERTDARWFWAGALVLLAIETALRRRADRSAAKEEIRADAA
jgi:hypothetical protein